MRAIRLKSGDGVRYIPFEGAPISKYEKGIVKRISEEGFVFVVYNCGDDWENYSQYTAANTPIEKLILGWE